MGENNFGNRISALRKSKGFTQAYIAGKLGVTPAAVSKWENGSSKPRVEVLFKLAQILEVNAKDLFEQEYEEPPVSKPTNKFRKEVIIALVMAVAVLCIALTAAIIANLTKEIKVPNLIGKTCVEAEQLLDELGLEYQAIGEYSERVPQNIVMMQNVKAYSMVKKKSVIVLTVSKGRQPIPIPNVEGFPLEYAKKVFEDLGLVVVVNPVRVNSYPDGVIVTQSRQPGTTAYRGTVIYLGVNNKYN